MQESKLTANGVDKIFGKMENIIIQLSAVVYKFKNNQHFYSCQISDGFCKNKGCIIENNFQESQPKLTDNAIIKVMKSSVQKSKQQQAMVIIVEAYEMIYLQVKKMVGNAIPYEEYLKNGKNNDQGDNIIPKEYVMQNGGKNAPKNFQIDDFIDDTKDQGDHSNANGKMVKENQGKKNQNMNDNASKSMNNLQQSKLNLTVKNEPKIVKQEEKINKTNQNGNRANHNTSMNGNVKVQSNSLPKAKYQPIEKVEKRQIKPHQVVKMNQKKPNNEYNQIKSLFVGIQNWTILVRVLFMYPIKTIMTKKGTQSTILSLQVGDSSGTIECTIFGQTAVKYQMTLKQDNIYEISGGQVVQSVYMGKHQTRITINQMTKISLKEDDANISYIQDFCITVSQLNNVPIGEDVKIICLVKDNNEVEEFVSKAGKQLKKKKVLLLDPEDKIQVQATIWGQRGYEKFQKYPYVIKGIQIGEFMNTRQYTIRQNYIARVLKQHNFRKYIKDMDNMQLTNPNSNNKTKKNSLSDLRQLANALDDGENVWTDAICHIITIKQASKNFYVSCPFCKKKVGDEENTTCISCGKYYDQPKYRYILNLNVADQYQSLWITAYDEAGEKIIGVPAERFAVYNQEELQEQVNKIRYKEVKLKLLTKNQTYNNQSRKKTSIIKIIDINYAQESKRITQKLMKLLQK